ncbi:hypothetical protein [Sediminicola sp. 1XM1-17]
MMRCLILFSILIALLVFASIVEPKEASEEQQLVIVDDFGKMSR